MDADTDTGTGPGDMSCQEGLNCVLAGTDPETCFAQTDAEGQALMTALLDCATQAGCLENLDTATNCVITNCPTQAMACWNDT